MKCELEPFFIGSADKRFKNCKKNELWPSDMDYPVNYFQRHMNFNKLSPLKSFVDAKWQHSLSKLTIGYFRGIIYVKSKPSLMFHL